MPVDVSLGDLAWRWQLRDDRALEHWLSRLPWMDEGGVVVAQVADDEDGTIAALEREIYAADRRRTDVRVVKLVAETGTFIDLVAEWMNRSRRHATEIALALAEDLAFRPTLFIVDARRARDRVRWADEASALWDLMSKLEVERRPSVLVLHRRGEAPPRGRLVLDRGWPVGLAHALVAESEDDLWAKYVHLRIAWESGGVIEDAFDCAAIAADQAVTDDDAVEQILNCFAMAKYLRMTDDEQSAWMTFVLAPSVEAVPTVCGYTAELEGRLTPFPWLARALLLKGTIDRSTCRTLRAEMICRPIAEQVLNRCFAAEASLRRRLPSALPEPPDDVRRHYERFASATGPGQNLEADLYPFAHPSPPVDAWDFASVGVIARHIITVPGGWRDLERVRLLRNAVAHCHYMGWKGITEARAIRGLVT